MASRRTGSFVANLAKRFVAAAVSRSKSTSADTVQSAMLASPWQLAKMEYPQPGLLASTSPWTHHRQSQEQLFPWSLRETQKQHLYFSSAEEKDDTGVEDLEMDVSETREILRHVNAVALKKRIRADPRDSFSYLELLELIKESGVVCDDEEAKRFAQTLGEAGVVLIFRENVYLHPERVARLVANALPFAVVPPNDPRRAELVKLEEEKAKVDALAHKQVRRYLYCILGALTCQVALFFRLTFWELSWDVMEPIAFFVTSAGLIGGYAYFLITARDPSYRDFMQRLFISKQMKLFKKQKFDYLRYQMLRRQCQCVEPDEVVL